MPELPEVEHIRRTLAPRLIGRIARRISISRADVCTARAANGASRPVTTRDLLLNARINSLDRRGKQLAIRSLNECLCIHLGMSGQLVHTQTTPPDHITHIHVTWRLDDGSTLYFRDPRRFGGIWAFSSFAGLERERWATLGPDALTITGEELHQRTTHSRRAIKAALLDQVVTAGVGNIYADEALYRAGIRPMRCCASLNPDELDRLATAIRTVLCHAIEAGGSTVRTYIGADGKPGRAQHEHLVYGRAGLPCGRCGAKLRGLAVAQRTTVFCATCQPAKGIVHRLSTTPVG